MEKKNYNWFYKSIKTNYWVCCGWDSADDRQEQIENQNLYDQMNKLLKTVLSNFVNLNLLKKLQLLFT